MTLFIALFGGLLVILLFSGLVLCLFPKVRKFGIGLTITSLLILLSLSFVYNNFGKRSYSETVAITPEIYRKIKEGMTPDEVKELVGGSARSEEIKEDDYFIWEYEGEKGIEVDASADLLFEDDRLSSKFESGLLTKHDETDSEETYDSEATDEEDELESLKSDVEYEIESIVEDNYTTASIEKIEINEDMGSDKPNKLIALVHLSFDVKNSAQTSYNMVELYSDDLAAKIGSENDTVNQIAVFWKVPYIDKHETLAKFSYERSGEHMIITDKVSSLR